MKFGLRSRNAQGGELLAFDTEFWNVRMARGYNADITEWALENMVGCLFLLIESADQEAIQAAEGRGARFMDIRVELARDTAAEYVVTASAKPAQMDALAAISRTAFRGLTRFYADPQLSDDRCDDLYENWLRTSPGWAAQILVVLDENFDPGGFVTIHVDGDEASIGLIAVGEQMRGQGWGTYLSRAAVDWAYRQGIPRIKVVTQGCNIPAQRAFQHAGFVTTRTDIWMHQWL